MICNTHLMISNWICNRVRDADGHNR